MLTLRKNSLKYKDENGVMQDSGVLFSSGATEVDTTLSKSGMAADAKTVGDELVKLSEENADFTVEGEVHLNLNDEVYIRGYIHNATEEDTEYYQSYKSANYIPVNSGKSIECFTETTNFVEVVEYDYKYKFIKKTNLYSRTSTEDVTKTLTLSDNTKYIRICKFSGVASDMNNAKISIYYSEDAINEHTSYSEVKLHTFVDYKMIHGVENDSIKLFGTVLGMKNCTTLKSGDVCVTLGYRIENDGGNAQYLITDATNSNSDTHQELLSNGLYATLMHDGAIDVKQLGAYGDGSHNDAEYLQKALDLATKAVIIPSGRYRLTNKVYVRNKNNFNIYANEAIIINDANDYALQFTTVNGCNCYFYRILGRSTQSGGLEFYSIDNNNYVQYMNIYFTDLLVKTNCIYIHGDAGWVSELRFHGGRFMAYDGVETAIGCKIDANQGQDFTCDHFSFYNVGIEGIKTGFHFIGKEDYTGSTTDIVQCVNIIDCRSLENFTTLIRTEGIVRYIRLSTSCLIYARYFDLSEKTMYSFIEAMCAESYGSETSWRAIIHEGAIIPQDNPRCLRDTSREVLDLSLSDVDAMMSVYNLIEIYNKTTKLKLSKQYGILGGKNTFLVRMIGKNTDGVLICDYEDNVISDCSNINVGDIVRFTWIMTSLDTGYWFAEKVNTIALTTS